MVVVMLTWGLSEAESITSEYFFFLLFCICCDEDEVLWPHHNKRQDAVPFFHTLLFVFLFLKVEKNLS